MNMKPLKFFLYVRKSSESEDRQVQSLEDQINIMKKKAKTIWINIIDTFIESKSAKAPWREQFNIMISKIKDWEANWIISWKLDRLSRNPIDTWTIQYMLQTWVLYKIITNDRDYNPEDAWLLMSVETWMANQFILDLKKNVKRWMDSKYEKWQRPTKAPLWYINDKWEKTIEIDQSRFKLVRQMWDLMLTWNYTPTQINNIICDTYWLRTRKTKNQWWNKMTNSWVYRTFHNIFYTGYYYYKWELIQWKHTPMITLTEYDRVQELLWKKWNPRAKTYDFPFTWMIRCWECWCSITAEIKRKHIKSTNLIKEYTYYHCTKKKKNIKCSQKTIRDEELESQVMSLLNQVEIIADFRDWGLEVLQNDYEKKSDLKIKQIESINKTILSEESELKKLTKLLIKGLIDEEEFIETKQELKNSITKLKDQREKIDLRSDELDELSIRTFDFLSKSKDTFKYWNIDDKKSILSTLGKNFMLKDWIVNIDLNPWFQIIKERLPRIKWELERLEPTKKGISKINTNTLNSENSLWLCNQSDIRTNLSALYRYISENQAQIRTLYNQVNDLVISIK